MILVIDIGNTKVSLGLYENGKLVEVSGFTCPKNISINELVNILNKKFSDLHIDGCIISSVVDELNEPMSDAILRLFKIKALVISVDLSLGINIKMPNPEKVGMDRIANVCAASKLYKERPLIVVDSGSATTFDIINQDGDFIGGLIFPGLDMQLNSLYEKTSKLPKLDLNMVDDIKTVINNNTQNAILSGVVQGQAQAVQGLIAKCEEELCAKAFIVGTGGNVGLLNKYMESGKFDVINPTLTLDGINMIYEMNMD